jgi:hypothetical protein
LDAFWSLERWILRKIPSSMGQFSRNVTFHAVAIDHLYTERPQVSGKILQAVMDLVVEGRIKTASPLLAYPVSELEDAFRSMQSGKKYRQDSHHI